MHQHDRRFIDGAFIDIVHTKFGAVIRKHCAVAGTIRPVGEILEALVGCTEHNHAGRRSAMDRYHFSLLM